MSNHDLALPATLTPLLMSALPRYLQRARGYWSPAITILGLIHLVAGRPSYRGLCRTMQRDLGNLFETDRLHPSAFMQARERLSKRPEILEHAFATVYAHAEISRRTRSMRYGDFTLIAIDGTSVPLAPSAALARHFGTQTNQHGQATAPQAHISLAWDVGAHQPMDYVVGAYTDSELTLSKNLLGRLPATALVLADRLYGNRHVMADLEHSGRHFLIRCQTGSNGLREVQAFAASGEAETIVEIACFSTADPQRYPRDELMQVRLLRGRDGEHVYATNLRDTEVHARETLLCLYATRWRIETAFRELKLWTNLTRIRATKPALVEQEIVAVLIYALLLSELDGMACEAYADEIAQINQTDREQTAEPLHGGRRPLPLRQNVVRFNRPVMCLCVQQILSAAAGGDPEDLHSCVTSAISYLWAVRSRVKSGRSYPRVSTRPHSKWNRQRQDGLLS